MRKRSWLYRKESYYFLFVMMLIIHATVLVVRMKLIPSQKKASEPSMVVKVIKLKEFSRFSKQIVESENPAESTKPKNSPYLSDKDRSFDRQTKARNIDIFQNMAQGNASSDTEAQKPSKNQPKKSGKTRTKDIKLSDLGAAGGSGDPFKQAAKKYSQQKKMGVNGGDPNSRGISSTNDHLEGIPLGDLTNLNTVEYKYYGFYHRIRQKLEQFWGKSIQEKAEVLVKQGRRLPGGDELITALQITMDQGGNILRILIRGSSGVKELDDAAIESFQDAGPFPNPPRDLVVNGMVTLEWGFVVKS